MKISLRRANALQLQVKEQLLDTIAGTVTIGKYDDPSLVFSDASSQLQGDIHTKLALIGILYSIRKKINAASQDVNNLVTDLAEIDYRIKFCQEISQTRKFAPTGPGLADQHADLKAGNEKTAFGRQVDSIEVGLLPKESVEGFKKSINDLKKIKQKISDKLLHLNVSTEIELSADEESVLKTVGIL